MNVDPDLVPVLVMFGVLAFGAIIGLIAWWFECGHNDN